MSSSQNGQFIERIIVGSIHEGRQRDAPLIGFCLGSTRYRVFDEYLKSGSAWIVGSGVGNVECLEFMGIPIYEVVNPPLLMLPVHDSTTRGTL